MDYIYDKNQGYTHSPHRLFVLVGRFDCSCPDHRYAPTIARPEAWCEETGSSLLPQANGTRQTQSFLHAEHSANPSKTITSQRFPRASLAASIRFHIHFPPTRLVMRHVKSQVFWN